MGNTSPERVFGKLAGLSQALDILQAPPGTFTLSEIEGDGPDRRFDAWLYVFHQFQREVNHGNST